MSSCGYTSNARSHPGLTYHFYRASYASTVVAVIVCLSVCLSVRLSARPSVTSLTVCWHGSSALAVLLVNFRHSGTLQGMPECQKLKAVGFVACMAKCKSVKMDFKGTSRDRDVETETMHNRGVTSLSWFPIEHTPQTTLSPSSSVLRYRHLSLAVSTRAHQEMRYPNVTWRISYLFTYHWTKAHLYFRNIFWVRRTCHIFNGRRFTKIKKHFACF